MGAEEGRGHGLRRSSPKSTGPLVTSLGGRNRTISVLVIFCWILQIAICHTMERAGIHHHWVIGLRLGTLAACSPARLAPMHPSPARTHGTNQP